MSMDEHSGNLADGTTGTAETMPETVGHPNEELRKRRSTRIMQAVPLAVSGVDALGRPFTEHTSTLIINCHGCRYQSKHYVLKNMWVTLEVPHPEAGHVPRTVRGRVAWIQRPRTVRQLFQVALELETPGNAWGIAFPPSDWFAVPDPATAVHVQDVHSAPQEAPKTAEIHLPLTEPEPVAAPPQDNLRVFPAPVSATDASLQLARHMARLVADAKQQLQATARELVTQAVGAERRVSFDEWEQRITAGREALTQQVASALDRIQQESENWSRSAHKAAAEALQRELPGWIAPQLEQLARELTQQISERGAAEREEHTKQLSVAIDALHAVLQQAEESAARLRLRSEEARGLIADRASEAAIEMQEAARQHAETADAHREAIQSAANETQQQVAAALSAAQSTWQNHLNTEMESASGRWQETLHTALAEAQEKAAAGFSEHAQRLISQLREEAAQQTAASRESITTLTGETEQRIREVHNSLLAEGERQLTAGRESAASAQAATEQRIAALQNFLQNDAAQQTAAARDSIAAAAAEVAQRIADLRSSVHNDSERDSSAAREAVASAIVEAEGRIAALRAALQEDAAHLAAEVREWLSNAAAEAEQRTASLRSAADEQSRGLESTLVRAAESTGRLEHLSARLDTTQRQALAGFESQIDDVLSLHRNELHRRSETLLEEIDARIRATFDETCQNAVSRFDQQVDALVQPHISQTEAAIHRLAGGRSLLDAALTLQQDRIRTSADQAFAESLAAFRENLGGVEQLLQEAASSVSARNLVEYEAKVADLKHQNVDDLMKSAEWYEKKAQTQIQHLTERTLEQAEQQFREKAREVSAVFTGELDHSSRGFLNHAQSQMDETVREAFAQARALFSEAAETTTAAFTDEIQRQARTELDGFNEESQRTLNETRDLLGMVRTELAQSLSAEQEAFLRQFRERMSGTLEAGVSEAQHKVQSTFTPLLDSWKATIESHRNQMRATYQELSQHAAEQHRNRLENVSNQWMLATVASLNQQSREAVASIATLAEEKLRETCAQVFANVGDALRERLQQIASGFSAPEPPLSRGHSAGGTGT